MLLSPITYTYKTVGDCSIKADVYSNPDNSKPTAAIVYIHGGCLIYGSRKNINQKQLEQYIIAGYTVISIDYRLAPETKLPEIIRDLQDGFTWIYDSGPNLFAIDPHRLAVVGHSAGGYLALMSALCVQPKPKAIVSFYGYGDIAGDWYSKPDDFYCRQPKVSKADSGCEFTGPECTEPYAGRGKDKFYLYCRQNGLWPNEVGGHDPIIEREFFNQYCPVQNVTADYPPTLLLHGNRDTDVPYEQSVLMANVFSDNNVEHEFLTMRNLGHGFDNQAGNPMVQDAFKKVIAFLDRQMN